jgi:hypothetical protein
LITIDLRRQHPANLRNFDPEEIARLDTEMWRSYYAKERLKLFNQLAFLLRRQYHMSLARSYIVGFHAAKAAFVFKDGTSRADYERALPDLLAYYQAIRNVSQTPFDVNRAAALELEWWIVHRQRQQQPDRALDHALANLSAEIYQLPTDRFAEHAKYRAAAMTIRDDSAEEGQVSEAQWQEIHELLRRSWLSLWHAVNDAE